MTDHEFLRARGWLAYERKDIHGVERVWLDPASVTFGAPRYLLEHEAARVARIRDSRDQQMRDRGAA